MESNSTTTNQTSDYALYVKIENFTILSLNIVSFILNLICAIVFTNKQFNNRSVRFNIFKYFLIKAVVDCLLGLNNIIVYFAFGCLKSDAKLFIVRVHYVLVGILSYINILDEIVASVLINLSMSQEAVRLSDTLIDYKIVNLVVVVVSALFNLVRVAQCSYFTAEIVNKISDPYDFNYSLWLKWLSVLSGWIRDCLLPIVLTISNVVLLVKFNKTMKRKVLMRSNTAAATAKEVEKRGSKLVRSKATNDLIKMALVIGVKSLSGHVPLFLNRMNLLQGFLNSDLFSLMALTLFYISIATEFFVFYYFNHKFKFVYRDYFNFVKTKICFFRR
jgi:hypothetical protein